MTNYTDTNLTDGKLIGGGGGGGESGEWARPADRPAEPITLENEIDILMFATPKNPNDYGITITTTGAVPFKMEWGDGTTTSHVSGSTAFKSIDYDDISTIIQPDGNKYFYIKVFCNTDDIVDIDFHTKPASLNPAIFPLQALEIYINCPGANIKLGSNNSSTIFGYYFLDSIKKIAGNTPTHDWAFSNLISLQNLEGFVFGTVKNNFMNNCSLFNQKFEEGNYVTFYQTSGSFMSSCISYNQPFPKGFFPSIIELSNFLEGCTSYNQLFPDEFIIDGSSFMKNCTSFNKQLPQKTGTVNGYGFLENCTSFNKQLPELLVFRNNRYDFMVNCVSYSYGITMTLGSNACFQNLYGKSLYCLKSLRLINQTVPYSLSVANTKLNSEALVLLFGDLPNGNGNKITITTCYGADDLTPAQRAIATNKNWTIIG